MNKRTFFLSLILILVINGIVFAQDNIKVSGIASKGGKVVRVSANTEYKLMETYPQCVVTVYQTGTLTLASIYNDEAGASPKSNPFTSFTDASYSFYVAPGRYDIKFSGTGILIPFTISDVFVVTGGGGGGSGVDSFNGRTGVVVPVDGDYTFTGLNFTGSNFNSIATRSASDLNAGTIPDARFPATLPAISGINLTNLNASNIASGTLADARLSTNVPLLNAVNTFTANNIFNGTAVGIGTTTPRRKLDVLDGSNAQIRLSAVDNSVYTDLFVDSGGSLNIIPTGNIAFDATGNQVNPLNNYDQNLGQINKKYLSLHAAELVVETLVAQNTVATIGGRIIVAPTNQLIADLAPATTTINVKYNNFSNGDRVYMEAGGQVEFFAITSGASVITGGFSYTVTRNLDGTGANQWYAGDAMVNTGVSGKGFIDLYSTSGVKSGSGPTIVGNVRNSTTYNDWTESWAIGNLNGIYGYGADTYGAAFGKYAASNTHLTVDSTNGFRIFNGLSTVIAQWETTGAMTIGPIGAGQPNVRISAGLFQIRDNLTARIQLNSDGSGFLANNLIAWDSSGNFSITGNSTIGGWTIGSTSITSTGIVIASGANAYLAFGATPPTSASSGTGIFLDRTGLYGLNSNVVQVKVDSTGKLLAGAGAVTLSANGLEIAADTGYVNRINWVHAGSITDSSIRAYPDSLSTPTRLFQTITNVAAGSTIEALTTITVASTGGTGDAHIQLWSKPSSSSAYLDIDGNAGFKGVNFGKPFNTNYIPVTMIEAHVSDSALNTSLDVVKLNRWTSGSAGSMGSGFGVGQLFQLESSSFTMRDASRISTIWSTPTDASRTSAIVFQTINSASALTEVMRIGGNSVAITGDLTTNSVQWNTGTRPTCNSGNRGKVWYVAGGAGVADTFEVCKKDAGDAYAWTALY